MEEENTEVESGEPALDKELEAQRSKNEDLLSRLKYMQADLENLRKRTDKEVRDAGESSVRALVARLLPVLDELELAAAHAGEEVREGIGMVNKNLSGVLESVGVERVESVGRPFDPRVHEAAEKVQGGGEEDMVVEELRPGYAFRGQLLRPSLVKVQLAKPKAKEESEVE